MNRRRENIFLDRKTVGRQEMRTDGYMLAEGDT